MRRVVVGVLALLAAAPGWASDFRSETIYFLLPTRFSNGDPANDFYNRDRIDASDPHWRGDFKGLIAKLPYIKDLGFTAIWITPPVENRSGLDYHGYHAYDWTRIDPRLESEGARYQDLIDAAHALGIKIIQDVVVNHSSSYGIRGEVWVDRLPIKYYRPRSGTIPWPYTQHLGDYTSPNREDNDNPVAPVWFRVQASKDPDGTDSFVDPTTNQPITQLKHDPRRFFNTDAGTLDPAWYHQDGWIAGGDWENQRALQRKHMAGDCLDLATENANVRDYINNAVISYLRRGVDAIRVDTAKHVERDELLGYVDAWKAAKPGTFVFGEVLVKGLGFGDLDGSDNGPSTIRPWWYTRRGGDVRNPHSGGDSGLSVLDFSLFSTFRDNVANGHFGGVGGVFAKDWVYGDATQLVTFFQNHDVGPDNDFRYRFRGEAWKAAIAYNMLWTVRGIPSLYYGEEIEFMKGAPQDISGNDDKLAQTGRAYFGDHLEGDALRRTQSHPLYQHIKRLNQIRRAVPALQRGRMTHVNDMGSGLAFVRDAGSSYAVVGLAAGGRVDFDVQGIRNGIYRDAVTGAERRVADGRLGFAAEAHSAGIWVLDGPGKIGSDGAFLR